MQQNFLRIPVFHLCIALSIQVLTLHLATKISSEGVNLDKQAFNAS